MLDKSQENMLYFPVTDWLAYLMGTGFALIIIQKFDQYKKINDTSNEKVSEIKVLLLAISTILPD